ncbi:MAG: 2Fe-2S iron-sulfur cluster binding domain-containing protein [Magnetococcales bacterium]|nr:2Fe-2S iron-sulfur cluster binding domain-containing protein [Magnetococcales bacterium]
MTALELFYYVVLWFFLQVTCFGGMAFYRHWLVYQELRHRLAGFEIKAPDDPVDHMDQQRNDQIVQAVGWDGFREFCVQRKVFEDVSCSVCSLYLVPTDGKTLPTFRPGQFLTFQFDIADQFTGQTKRVIRCYSLSDRPGLGYYRVSIKRVLPPIASSGVISGVASNYVHDAVHEGTKLLVKAPSGQFFLGNGDSPVVMIAGGIGITPMLSMLNENFEQSSSKEIWLFYGVRNGNEQVRKEYLESLAKKHPNFHLHVCYSRPQPDDVQGRDFQHLGHLDIALLRLTLMLKPYRFYVCGPQAMLESIVPALDAWGVPEQHIHFEAFGPASLVKPTRSPASLSERTSPSTAVSGITVVFSKSKKILQWDENANSLLDFSEQNGIEVASGCRAGGCGTCQTSIQAGDVKYFQEPEFALEPGSCLLCISKPKRDLTLVA